MSAKFQISYTLDILLYICCMIDKEKRNLYIDDVNRFEPILGTISDKYLEKLRKVNQNTPGFINYIISMLIVNDHLHEWTTTDLFGNHNRLASMFKKSKYFKKASPELKRFANGSYSRQMSLIKTIANDLERLGFKKFWLEKKLPFLKKRTAECEKLLSEFNIIQHLNGWLESKKLPLNGQWYMLAYSGDSYKLLLNEFNVTSPIIPSEQLFDRVVTYALSTVNYAKFCKVLKPTPALKAELKGHGTYKKLKGDYGYAVACLKKALEIYLMAGYNKLDLEVPEDYPFMVEIFAYLCEHEKQADVAAGGYLTEMMKHFSR